jgi:hypothetical protein
VPLHQPAGPALPQPQPPTTAPTDPTTVALATRLLHQLGIALTDRDLRVRVQSHDWSVVATNEAPTTPDGPPDPLAAAYGPVKLTQRVTLALNARGHLWWHWQWSGPTRGAPPEYQPLCLAQAIAEATERVTRVLAPAPMTDEGAAVEPPATG